MPAVCRSKCRGSSTGWSSIAGCRRSTRRIGARWRAPPPAHSTVTIQRPVVVPFSRIRRSPAAAVAARRSSAGRTMSMSSAIPDGTVLRASHDGYAKRLRRHPPPRYSAERRWPRARRRRQLHDDRRPARPLQAPATNLPSGFICIRRSRRAGCLTAEASSCCCRTAKYGPSQLWPTPWRSRKACSWPARTARAEPCRS